MLFPLGERRLRKETRLHWHVVLDDDFLAANWLADGAESMAHDGNDGDLHWFSSNMLSRNCPHHCLDQQPRQIEFIILSTFASSRSMAGLVPRSGPLMGPWPMPDDESAVPKELVPGAAALVPKAPPVADMCDPMPAPPRASAAVVERPTQSAMPIAKCFFIPRLLQHTINVTVVRRCALKLMWVRASPPPLN